MHGVNLTLCRFVNVHLFNLLTGLPHKAPLRKVLPLNWGHQGDCLVVAKQINSSRIALVVKSISDVAVSDIGITSVLFCENQPTRDKIRLDKDHI